MSFIGKILSFTFLHASQADSPVSSFGSSAAFKTALDSQAAQLQTALNNVIDQLNSVVALSSGAENLGSAPIAGVSGGVASTVYAQIADIKSQLTGIALGLIPDGTITYAKHDVGTQMELQGGFNIAYKNGGFF